MTLHTAYAVRYGASTVLAGLTNLTNTTNPEVQNDSGIGTPFPQFVAIVAQKPRIQFATRAVAGALDVTGSTGAAIGASNTLTAQLAKLGDNGLPVSASEHRTYTANRGLLIPRRLTCQHRQSAQLDVEALLFSSDGAAHPLVIADNTALFTLVRDNIQHTIGTFSIGTSGSVIAIGCPQSITVDFGQNAETIGCGSDLYDRHMHQPSIKPVITITGLNATAFGAAGVPPVGKAIDHANSLLVLRKRSPDGIGFVADDQDEHIGITCNGVAVVTQHTAQGTSRAEVTIQITGSWDGTNAPIVIDTEYVIAP